MQRKVAYFLQDALDACMAIRRYLEGKSFDDYLGDDLLRSGIERQFLILGEALNQALRLDPLLEDAITDHRKIVQFRNVLAHAYFRVKNELVFGLAQSDLKVLARELEGLVSQE